LEGSFWRLGHDLGDIYTGEMTLRQLWLRINLLAEEPDSPLRRALRNAHLESQKQERDAALDDVHTRYQRKG
jgi:hypothetical protein